MGNAHGVLAFQGLSPLTQARQLVTAGMPSWRSSCWLRIPGPRRGSQQANGCVLGSLQPLPLFRLQGFGPRENRSLSPGHV
jgi:hypothetical protein